MFFSILHMWTRSERIINIHIKDYINKPRLWKRPIKLLVIEMIKVYNTLAPEYLWQKFLKLRTTNGTTKSIMAKNVLVIGWGEFIWNQLPEDMVNKHVDWVYLNLNWSQIGTVTFQLLWFFTIMFSEMGFFLSQIYTHSSTYKLSLKETYASNSEYFI